MLHTIYYIFMLYLLCVPHGIITFFNEFQYMHTICGILQGHFVFFGNADFQRGGRQFFISANGGVTPLLASALSMP